jgi:predicted membrane protein
MDMDDNNIKYKSPHSKVWTGLFLVAAGFLLMGNKMGLGIPGWIFTWPVLIIAFGFLMGLQHNFRNFFWIIPVLAGSYWLLSEQMPSFHLQNFGTPMLLILIGAVFIFRPRHRGYKREWKNKWREYAFDADREDGEYLDSTSVFGGAKKVVVSKNFKGGDITCFMGGAEIDFTQADIQGHVVVDITAVFGGAKIIVPSNWDVKIETTAAFGSVEDKRQIQTLKIDSSKTLVLKGTAVFGGIEINNY